MPEKKIQQLHKRKGRPRKVINGNGKTGNGHVRLILKGAEELVLPKTIIKRDGRVMSFDAQKIEKAITKCFASLGADPNTTIPDLTRQVINAVAARYKEPTVEQVQDVVEMILQAAGEFSAAKHYILYRAEHAKLRETRPVPEEVRAAFEESEIYFPSQLQKFQFFDKYSRFSYEVGRRETWKETVDRALSFLHELAGEKVDADTYKWISRGILEMKAAPSMRLLAMAGPAAGRNNIAIYNCSYLPIDSVDSFVEPLLISMNGCGVGFSVESKYVENLPRVRRQTGSLPLTYSVADTTEGWSDALRVGLSLWFEGGDIKFDYSQIRPAGAILKTKGGRASGPEPLKHMLEFVRARLLARQGSFLRPLDAHDIVCEVGNAAVSGGMRRTAMISLFDWDDAEMRDCKNGDFERENSQRWNANNSAVWPDRGITQPELVAQMLEMVNGGRGEPGIFNRQSAISLRPARRAEAEFGTNPCGEIVLRPYEFCNLSIAIARQGDSYESLSEKVELAAVIGTIQALATNFPGLRPMWKQNCQEERLVGVDITGQLDSQVIQNPAVMSRLRQVAVETNRKITQQLGINQAASVTCVKPSGNSSQLFDCASGLHARWSSYYVRNVRVGTHTPMFKVLQDSGVPMDPENGQSKDSANTWVAHFPVKSPEGAVVRKGRSAIRQCEYWLQNKIHWTEHNPSVTITYHPDEVIELIKWVWEHRDMIGGMSFLPAFDAKYAQMPFEEVDRETYEALAAKFPNIDFSKLYRYEEEDYTKAAQELACIAGACEIEFVPDGKGGEIAAQGVS